jgi:hypothetical protein
MLREGLLKGIGVAAPRAVDIGLSKAEAHSNRGIDIVVLEKAKG